MAQGQLFRALCAILTMSVTERAMTAAAAKQSHDEHSHFVRPQDMPWEKMRFPGCECKTLLFDAKSGLATVLMKMEPGATLPDHEHVMIEQTYVLSGSL